MRKMFRTNNKMVTVTIAIVGMAGAANLSVAQAQLQTQTAPIRIQIGNGPALLGPNEPTAPVGISILSNQVGAANDAGTSIRLLGPNKTLGLYTTLLKTNSPNGTDLQLSSPVDALTAPLIQ
ncbi:hypothetical protein K3M67_21520 (plasmid) [Sphingobium sp. V4]|uniref:hypothetical protein n=1 Tax=Sphingobium sp. V4 TaxID=3038927 RepID=UPI002557F6E6|nr:hypothetical protein [Sphingobium sp. V4]WIW91141.1 hypothetical protein K3M67_21520 [Sphingobium sp. V4]